MLPFLFFILVSLPFLVIYIGYILFYKSGIFKKYSPLIYFLELIRGNLLKKEKLAFFKYLLYCLLLVLVYLIIITLFFLEKNKLI